MWKAQEYREHARRCERQIGKVRDPRIRERLQRERQAWLDLAAGREAALRDARRAGALPREQGLTAVRDFGG